MEQNSIKRRLYESSPAFKIYPKTYEKSIYVLFGDFGIFLRDQIMSAHLETLPTAFHFINEMLDENDNELDDLLKTTTLETLCDYEETRSYALAYLNEKGKLFMKSVIEKYFN